MTLERRNEKRSVWVKRPLLLLITGNSLNIMTVCAANHKQLLNSLRCGLRHPAGCPATADLVVVLQLPVVTVFVLVTMLMIKLRTLSSLR